MSFIQRLDNLRSLLVEKNIDAVLISSYEGKLYYSNANLKNGFLVVTHSSAALFSDYDIEVLNPEIENIVVNGRMYQNIATYLYKNNIKTLGYEDKDLTINEYKRLNLTESNIEFFPLLDSLVYQRSIKDEDELKSLVIGAKISDEVFSYVVENFKEGMTEKEVESIIEVKARMLGASGTSFDTVVSSGKNSALLHKKNTDKKILHGDILLLDYGILYDGYTVDMTRTVFVGEASDRAKEIYNIVYYAFSKTVEKVKEGESASSIDKCARDIISSFGYGDTFIHSTGHGVGLSIHEAPFISALSPDILKENMAITIEPGIYIKDFGGFRIEDTIVVGKDEAISLTNSPREIIIL